jgi:hypothetical protein
MSSITLRNALIASTVATLVAISSGAEAVTLPEAASFSSVVLNGVQQTSEFGTTSSSVSAALGGSSGSFAASSQPAPNMVANVSVNSPGQALAFGFSSYWFAVVGPSDVVVPVIVTASSFVSMPQTVGINSSALILVGNEGSQILGETCLSPAAPNNCVEGEQQSFSIATPLSLQSNAVYSIQLSLHIDVTDFNTSSFVGGTVSGYIDPVLTIDPTFALANEFHLEFSPGVGNSAVAVPGPIAGAGLPGIALAFGGFLAWRRRRQNAVAAQAPR